MPRDKKMRDVKLRNSRPTKQERLITDLVEWSEKEPLVESITIEPLPDKCLDCGEYTLYGKCCILTWISIKQGEDED